MQFLQPNPKQALAGLRAMRMLGRHMARSVPPRETFWLPPRRTSCAPTTISTP